jgi:predicted nuclease with TOPRIM domain
MKKKGQYEELLKEKQSLIDELTEKASKFDEFQTNRKKETEIKLVDLMEKVPKEILEENMDILEDLSDEKKIKFL